MGRQPRVARGRERGPDLAGAAVALLAVLHEAVPAARPGHKEPGVGCVGKARTAPLAEEGAQLAPAAGAEHPREWAPTGGEGHRACWHRHPRPPARLPSPPTSTSCTWPHRPRTQSHCLSDQRPGASKSRAQRRQGTCTRSRREPEAGGRHARTRQAQDSRSDRNLELFLPGLENPC